MNIIQHIEKFLGQISQGWKDKSSEDGLQVVCFKNSPFQAVDAFMTLGLSNHELDISDMKKVRQELILPVSGKDLTDMIVSCLLFICELILKEHRAVLRGQVIRLQYEAVEKLGFDAVYCAMPVFMEDAFLTFNGTKPPTVMVWIMPIYESEADYIDSNGWDKFEDVLEGSDPELFTLGRSPVI